eukprot:7391556-Prymnesium_polylepis.2
MPSAISQRLMSVLIRSGRIICQLRYMALHTSVGVPMENLRGSSFARSCVSAQCCLIAYSKSENRLESSGISSGELPTSLPAYRVPRFVLP